MKNIDFEQLEISLNSLFEDALLEEVFSGAVYALILNDKGRKKKLIKAFGKTRNDEKGIMVRENSVFDLASLTKPLCTTLCILSLVEENKLQLNSRLQGLIPDKINPYLEKIRIEHLLSHRSGLIDYRPYYADFKPVEFSPSNKKEFIRKIINEPLSYTTGSKCLYSDLGYILLGEIIENISEKQLNDYFKEKIAAPLGLENQLYFKKTIKGISIDKDIVATEYCLWRNKLIQGEVHDEHCWLMGGTAGHAGLFGTAEGVSKLAEHILNEWMGKSSHPSFKNNLLQTALNKKYEGETWCLGFDRPSREGSSSGKYLSPKSVGHLGYTGTSFWIDPEMELIMVLLTNRVHPSRKNIKIKEFRPLFHNTVVENLGNH